MVSHALETNFSTGPANDRIAAKQAQILARATMSTFEGRLKPHIKEGRAKVAKAVYGLKRDRVFTGAADFASFPRAAHNCIPTRHAFANHVKAVKTARTRQSDGHSSCSTTEAAGCRKPHTQVSPSHS
jgi:hypothetical protein